MSIFLRQKLSRLYLEKKDLQKVKKWPINARRWHIDYKMTRASTQRITQTPMKYAGE